MLARVQRVIRSRILTRRLDEGRIVLCDHRVPVVIQKHPTAKFRVNGTLKISGYFGGRAPVFVLLGPQSTLCIDGNYTIGPGVRICVSAGGRLEIGGGGGITCDSIVMAKHDICIRRNCIVAWGAYITDCDWHIIAGQPSHLGVVIESNVWIAHNASVLKGSAIGEGSIVAAHSTVCGGQYPSHSLIAGTPAKVARTGVHWEPTVTGKTDVPINA